MAGSDPMGLASAGGAMGAVSALRQIILEREMARRQALVEQQQQWENRFKTRGQDLLEQQHRDALLEKARENDALNADRTFKENQTLNESLPQGWQGPATSPIVGRLMALGSMAPSGIDLPTPTALAANPNESPELPGTIANAPSPIVGRLFTKQATQQQKEKAIADARLQADEARRAAADTSSADIRNRLADIAGQNADVRGRMADIAGQNADLKSQLAAAKAAEGPKLPQREDDTVVSIHQMLPMVDELLQNAQTRVTKKGAPSGVLGQVGQRLQRGGEMLAYKSGLAQGPDTDARIQLASLLQVLGTVPYLRGIRNMQFVQQIQQHLADPAATDESTIERLQTLKRILPGMEQAIYDVHNKGVIPHAHTGAMAPAAAPGAPAGAPVVETWEIGPDGIPRPKR